MRSCIFLEIIVDGKNTVAMEMTPGHESEQSILVTYSKLEYFLSYTLVLNCSNIVNIYLVDRLHTTVFYPLELINSNTCNIVSVQI